MPRHYELNSEEHGLIVLFRALPENDRLAVRIHVAGVSLAAQKAAEGGEVPQATKARPAMDGAYREGHEAHGEGVSRSANPYHPPLASVGFRLSWF